MHVLFGALNADELLDRLLGDGQVKLFKEMGIYDVLVDKIHQKVLLITDSEQSSVLMGAAAQIDTDIDITLDSGCVDHIIDLGDAPGYEAYIAESAGSKRKQDYVVGNGAKVPNEGQITLNLEHNQGLTDGVNLTKSVFQVAEISRPLMSARRVCDLGMSGYD